MGIISGHEKYQNLLDGNQKLFLKNIKARFGINSSMLVKKAKTIPFKPKILFVTPVLAHPLIGGPDLKIQNSIKALHEISELVIVSRVSLAAMGGGDALQYYKKYCAKFIFTHSATSYKWYLIAIKKIIAASVRKIIKKDIFTRYASGDSDNKFVLKTARRIKVDIIWL